MGEDTQDVDSPLEKRQQKPLFLLTCFKSVQTDPYPPTPAPAYPPSHSPSSAASVYSDNLAPSNNSGMSNLLPNVTASFSALIERMTALLQHLQVAEGLSLTDRPKRQQMRAGMGGGHTTTTSCIRVLLNVVPDPACATRVSEMAKDPQKAQALAQVASGEVQGASAGLGGGAGWMAMLLKLLIGAPAASTFLHSHSSKNASIYNGTDTSTNSRGGSTELASDSDFAIFEGKFFKHLGPQYRIQHEFMLHEAPHDILMKAKNKAYLRLYEALVNNDPKINGELHRELLTAHRNLLEDFLKLKADMNCLQTAFEVLQKKTSSAWDEAAEAFGAYDVSGIIG
ncbi:hypothetical protein B0H11DRAFT_2251097 [Mycena galericulata]|nr:hypothetical protein B0H11DRAFT_2251097 [Mycena galericulata]